MKRIIRYVLVLGLLVGGLTGCSSLDTVNDKPRTPNEENYEYVDTENFDMISCDEINGKNRVAEDELIIVKEKSTGKRFIIYKGYRKGGIAPLD